MWRTEWRGGRRDGRGLGLVEDMRIGERERERETSTTPGNMGAATISGRGKNNKKVV